MNARVALAALSLSLPILAISPCARAGDDEPGEPMRIDLSGFRAPPAAKAARATWVPSDVMFLDQTAAEQIGEDVALQHFEEPFFPDYAVSPDTVHDMVRRLVPEAADENWPLKVTKETDTLEIWGPKAGAEKARAAVRYLEAAMAPRLSVRAILSATKGADGGPRLLAAGAARLLPRRWTAVWLRTNVRRFTASYELEIAQEVAANKPVVTSLPEGEELYLRWSPGETTSVLEVFSSETAHRAPFDVDLSGIRNIPESNTQGGIQLPRTAARRAATAVALDASKPGIAEWAWDGPDGARTLRLSIDAAPPGPPDVALSDAKHTAFAVVRAGASASPLEQSGRIDLLDDAVGRFNNASSGGARGSASPEVQAKAFLVVEGPKAQIERLRAQVRDDERRLVAATVEVRAVSAPAAVLREDVETGRVVVGGLLDPAVATAYLRAPVHAAARLPATAGLKAMFLCGASVMGLSQPDVEVAQQAGGLYIAPRARFDGLSGTATVVPTDAGVTLRVAATVAWARPDAATLDLAFRRPFGMNNANGHPGGVDDPTVRRVAIPIEGHGSASVEADVLFAASEIAEGRWAVLAVALRPGATPDAPADPLLVLATVRR